MKPNIIIVMADQQRADLRKAMGFALDTMPFLDSWATGGVDFVRAYTPQPSCMPARVTMFTGRYAGAHRVRTNHNAKDAYYETGMLELLKEQGYKTALCGKNHSHYKNEEFDFFETCGHTGLRDGTMKAENENDLLLSDFLNKTKHMEMHVPAPGGLAAQHPYRNVSAALNFIDTCKDQPFFTWVSFAEPHNPYQVPEPYFDMFPPESLPPMPSTAKDACKKGEKYIWTQKVWENVLGDEAEKRVLRARSNYYGMLRLIDDQFKRLINGLRERGVEENTIVVYLADHGDLVGEYGMMRKGPDLPEALCRIPMIWRGLGVAPGPQDSAHCVSLVDIFPTVCDILGLDNPRGVQGKTLLPLLERKGILEDEYKCAYAESGYGGLYWNNEDGLTLTQEGACDAPGEDGRYHRFDCLNTWTQCGQERMLRKGDFKIQLDMMGKGYLYNLSKDPVELDNLFDDPAYLQVKADMLCELMTAALRACDPLPPPRRRYRLKEHPKGYWFQPYSYKE